MPTRDDAPIGAPCWIDLGTTDPERSRAFYSDLFGWTVVDPGPDYGGYANFAKDGVQVAGSMQTETNGWSVYLAVADAAATCDAAAAHGGAVVMPAMEVQRLGSMAMVADPGGSVVGLWQPGEHRGFGVYDEPNTPGWFELHTTNHAAVVDFYTKVFGWPAFAVSDTDDFRYTTYGEGEAQLAGIMDGTAFGGGAPAGWSVYFRVEQTDKVVARAEELGASSVHPPEDTPYGRLAHLHDPLGASFKLVGTS
jgi:predicted enzyme related to lactoylglutathione lyase